MKLLKPVVAILRRLGIRVVLYLDDMLIMASSREEAQTHLATAMHLLTPLEILNLDKSVLTPTQRVIFLGVLPEFTYHADLVTNSQDSVHTTPDQRDPTPRTGNHS